MMSKADEIFRKLEYVKEETKFQNDIEVIEYRQTKKDEIFEEVVKIIELRNPEFYEYPIINLVRILKRICMQTEVDLTLEELKAINLKCKELRLDRGVN